MNKQVKIKKYRPVLTEQAINHILTLAKKETPLSLASIEIISILVPFQAKIENDSIFAAYDTSLPKESIEESIGLIDSISITYSVKGVSYPTKEEAWDAAYNIYTMAPDTLTLKEMHMAKEHMYLNNLMTEAEILIFEITCNKGN